MNISRPFLKSVRFFLIVFIVNFSSCLANSPEQQEKLEHAQSMRREQLDAAFERITGKDPSPLSAEEKLQALQDVVSPIPLELLVDGEVPQDENDGEGEEANFSKKCNCSLNQEIIQLFREISAVMQDDIDGELYKVQEKQAERRINLRLQEMALEREQIRKDIVMGLIYASVGGSADVQEIKDEQDPEAHFFRPRKSKQLTSKEKEIAIEARIGKRYIGEIPSQVKDAIFYFSNHEECVRDNVEIYNRVLLYGKPGTGKTQLVNIASEELEVPLFSFNASFFVDEYIETLHKIRKAVEAAKKLNRPVWIFIKEIDALAGNINSENRRTLMLLLTEIQDLQDNKNIFVFFSMNDLGALDPALRDKFAGSVCEIK
jgi:SpoVK/Ycf46/Vps4 family AAA+-type ATPase